jgi:hypothetical protein
VSGDYNQGNTSGGHISRPFSWPTREWLKKQKVRAQVPTDPIPFPGACPDHQTSMNELLDMNGLNANGPPLRDQIEDLIEEGLKREDVWNEYVEDQIPLGMQNDPDCAQAVQNLIDRLRKWEDDYAAYLAQTTATHWGDPSMAGWALPRRPQRGKPTLQPADACTPDDGGYGSDSEEGGNSGDDSTR